MPSTSKSAAEQAWSVSGRLSYTGVPYSRLQQGTDGAPNPNDLRVSVHLATTQLAIAAPTGTRLDIQVPVGRLTTSTVEEARTDTNVGDLELRLAQIIPWLRRPQFQVTLGLAIPSGPYVERSGAANLPPEASFLTLGRGVSWGIAELQANVAITDVFSSYAQLSARTPFTRTKDEFDWGSEARAVVGGRAALPNNFSALAIAEWQWRGGASEPDPFSGMRLDTVNSGGQWWTATPAISFRATTDISVLAGLRVPLRSDVRGNQLVPGVGGFISVSASWSALRTETVKSASPTTSGTAPVTASEVPAPTPGKITVIDYWATWCAPCTEINATLAAAAPNWADVDIVKVDASGWPDNGLELPEGATGLPVVEIYDAQGVRAHVLLGNDALNVAAFVDKIRAR